MTELDQHFIDIGACAPGREWVATNCKTAAQAWELLLAEKHVDWASWWLATDGGWPAVEPLLKRWVLRILRDRAPALVDEATAERRRAIADDATWDELREGMRTLARALSLARAHALALDHALAQALAHAHALASDSAQALARARALDLALASDLAHVLALDQQVADLRELCRCPWTEPNSDCIGKETR